MVGAVPERDDLVPGGRPGPQAGDDGPGLVGREGGENDPVDDGRRLLVVHADAGGREETDPPVRGDLPEAAAGGLFEGPGHGRSPLHPRGDGIVQVDRGSSARREGKEVIERDRPADLRFGELQVRGDAADGLVGHVPMPRLDVAQDVEEGRRILRVAEDDVVFLGHGLIPTLWFSSQVV